MGDWTNTSPATSTTSGILRPEQLANVTTLRRYPAGPEVQRWVENYWVLHWDFPDGTSYDSQVLPHPACTLSIERGSARPESKGHPVVLAGVVTRRFEVQLTGRAWVLGIKFRPGGIAAMTGRSARPWRDAVLPATSAVPADLVGALAELSEHRPEQDCISAAEAALSRWAAASRQHDEDRFQLLLGILGDMLGDRTLLRVDQIAERHGISTRAVQRLFDHYIGVGPKWVLARYRIHDAVEMLDNGFSGSLTDLAHQHGWYDQAHFNRDFTRLVGVTPSSYRQR